MDFEELADIVDQEVKDWYGCKDGERPHSGYLNYTWTDLGNGDVRVHPSTRGGFMDSVTYSLDDFTIHVR